MKVVTTTPTENVKVENIFWEPYEVTFVPSMQEEEECPFEDEINTLQDAVIWLAEDIMDHEDALHMLWEKIQSVEDNQVQDAENLSDVIDIIGCLQETNKLTLDIIIKQNETIGLLSNKVNKLYNGIIFLVIWSLVLTILTTIISLNVFF